MKNFFFKKYRLIFIGVIIGGIGGWSYWHFIGCSSGQCAISSSPINSTIYGGVMGALLLSLFKKENEKK